MCFPDILFAAQMIATKSEVACIFTGLAMFYNFQVGIKTSLWNAASIRVSTKAKVNEIFPKNFMHAKAKSIAEIEEN